MHNFLLFWHFYFAPSEQPWWQGAVYGNVVAAPICAFLTYILVLRKYIECSEKRCYRIGIHKVKGTHFRTCHKHATKEIHTRLSKEHAEKFPEQHALLKGK